MIENNVLEARRKYNRLAAKFVEICCPFNEAIMHGQVIDLAIKHGGDIAGKKILDLGCGDGGMMKKVESYGATAWGIDVSENLIVFAAKQGFNRLTQGSMHKLDKYFSANFFDAIVSNFALHYLPKEGQLLALQSCHNVLRRGGLLTYSCAHPFGMRNGFFDPKKKSFPSKITNYFDPVRVGYWSEKEFGEELRVFRLDWPEIHSLLRQAGFEVLEMKDAVLPDNVDKIIEDRGLQKIAPTIEFFRVNTLGALICARKSV